MSCNLVKCSKRGTSYEPLQFKGRERPHQAERIPGKGFMKEVILERDLKDGVRGCGGKGHLRWPKLGMKVCVGLIAEPQ